MLVTELTAFDFYSRPCGRGDKIMVLKVKCRKCGFLLTPLREGRRVGQKELT